MQQNPAIIFAILRQTEACNLQVTESIKKAAAFTNSYLPMHSSNPSLWLTDWLTDWLSTICLSVCQTVRSSVTQAPGALSVGIPRILVHQGSARIAIVVSTAYKILGWQTFEAAFMQDSFLDCHQMSIDSDLYENFLTESEIDST